MQEEKIEDKEKSTGELVPKYKKPKILLLDLPENEKEYCKKIINALKEIDKILKETARSKMEMFINALGADAKYLTGEDTVKTKGLFDMLNAKETYQADEGVNEELQFLLVQATLIFSKPCLQIL